MTKSMLSITLLLAIAAPATAQVVPDPAPERFEAADTNDDGKVDRAEYDGFVAELALLYDANRDGRINREEVNENLAHNPARFDEIDKNRDQYINVAELRAYTDSDFAALDGNGDGAIDREEAQRGRCALRVMHPPAAPGRPSSFVAVRPAGADRPRPSGKLRPLRAYSSMVRAGDS